MKIGEILRALERILLIRPLWRFYTWFMRKIWLQRQKNVNTSHFIQNGYCSGQLNQNFVFPLVQSIEKSGLVTMHAEDRNQLYVANESLGKMEKGYNQHHIHYSLTGQSLTHLMPILDSLKMPIEHLMQSSWRIVNMHCWKTPPNNWDGGPSAWHTDRFATGIRKIMIYLSGANQDIGSTELKTYQNQTELIEGPPGTWLLFEVSKLWHRVWPPKEGERMMLQITIAPAKQTDVSPVLAGSNAQYPRYPWMTL